MPAQKNMRVTAIRVGADLWRVLEAEAARVDVSVSQYMREAALARASAAASARGEDPFEQLGQAASSVQAAKAKKTAQTGRRQLREGAREVRSDARALQAQSKQARRRSRQLAADPGAEQDVTAPVRPAASGKED